MHIIFLSDSQKCFCFSLVNETLYTATTPPGRTEQFVNTAESNTVVLVLVLILGVALIFICFALVAVCYRYLLYMFVRVCIDVG
jgi:hypothetical protein